MASNKQFCEPCLTESPPVKVSATTLCTDCQEYLCESCKKSHLKSKASRNHVLTDLTNAPSPDVIELLRKITACSKHEDTSAVYLCKTHDALCCNKCFFEEHRKCETVSELANLVTVDEVEADNEDVSTDMASMLDKYEEHAASLLQHENNQRSLIDDTEKSVNETLQKVKGIFEKAYNAIVTKVRTNFESEKETFLQTITTQTCGIERFMNEVIETKQTIQTVRDHGSPVHRYLFQNRLSRVKSEQLNNTMKDLHESVTTVQLNVSDTDDIETTVEGLERTLTVTKEEKDVLVDECPDIQKSDYATGTKDLDKKSDDVTVTPYSERTPVLLGSITLKNTNYIYRPPSCSWAGQYLVVTIVQNRYLHLIHENSYSIIDTYECESEPYSVCHIDNNTIVACLPHISSLLYLDVSSGKFAHPRPVKVKDELYDLAIIKGEDKMIGLCCEQGSLCELDTQGQHVNSISLHSDVVALVKSAYQICLDTKQEMVFVACGINQSVIAVNLNGELEFTYSDNHLKESIGLDVDNEGNVYVCSPGDNCVHQVNSRGEKIRELLSEHMLFPADFCFNSKGDKFAVVADQPSVLFSSVYSVCLFGFGNA